MINKEKMYGMISGIIWQDANAFIRNNKIEKSVFPLVYSFFLLVAGVACSIMILSACADDPGLLVLFIFAGPMLYGGIWGMAHCIKMLNLYSSMYDVELSPHPALVYRSKNGGYGILQIHKNTIRPLLKAEYSSIQRDAKDVFVITKGRYQGLYNSSIEKIVIPVEFNSISLTDYDRLYYSAKRLDHSQTYTSMGDRVIY